MELSLLLGTVDKNRGMMEDVSSSVAVTLSLSNPVCGNSLISSKMEIRQLELVTDRGCIKPGMNAVSLSVPGEREAESDISSMTQTTDNGQLVHDSQESEDECSISAEETSLNSCGVKFLTLDCSSSNSTLPLNVTVETALPNEVEIEGPSPDNSCIEVPTKLIEECSDGLPAKASVVALQSTYEKNSGKGVVKSVFEMACVPLWGSVSICGDRPEMEDAVLAVPHFMKIPIHLFKGDHVINGLNLKFGHLNSHFFGVYDGHGGSQVANYCSRRIHLALQEEINRCENSCVNGSIRDTCQVQWEKVFRSCFLKVDDEVGGKASKSDNDGDLAAADCGFEPVAPETVGSTAVVAVVSSSHIIVSNCGDSRAVLYRGKNAVPLSVDHKPSREDEYDRIEASGGKVIQWNGHRVFGVLAMSRAIGDRYLKPWIIPEPEVMFVPRAREDECLILGSDGLWDVITNEEACEVARKRILIWHKRNGNVPLVDRGQTVDPAAQAAAEYLSNLAIQKGSKDNVSVIVVDLKTNRKFKSKP